MKKHNDGYALVLVLVVITVLCIVALSMMAASLRNLQNQQASIDRMQDKYEAQGEIEKVIGNLEAGFQKSGNTLKINGFGQSTINQACADAKGKYEVTPGTLEYKDGILIFTLETECDTTNISCTIYITGTITPQAPESGVILYNIISPIVNYETYTITRGGGADE